MPRADDEVNRAWMRGWSPTARGRGPRQPALSCGVWGVARREALAQTDGERLAGQMRVAASWPGPHLPRTAGLSRVCGGRGSFVGACAQHAAPGKDRCASHR